MSRYLVNALLLMMAVAVTSARAELTEGQAKAGFLYNVARFVEWPAPSFSSATAPLVLCTRGLQPEMDAAMLLLGGKMIGDRPIRLEREPLVVEGCHVLFMGLAGQTNFREMVQSGGAVLVVSEVPGTLGQGAAIVIVPVGKRIAFNVDLGAVRRAGLKLGAPLLRLAHEVLQP